MAAAVSITSTKTREAVSLALTGATASTVYVFKVTHPNGGLQTITAPQTNGSGAVTVTCVPDAPGTLSVTVMTQPTSSTEVAATTAVVAA